MFGFNFNFCGRGRRSFCFIGLREGEILGSSMAKSMVAAGVSRNEPAAGGVHVRRRRGPLAAARIRTSRPAETLVFGVASFAVVGIRRIVAIDLRRAVTISLAFVARR